MRAEPLLRRLDQTLGEVGGTLLTGFDREIGDEAVAQLGVVPLRVPHCPDDLLATASHQQFTGAVSQQIQLAAHAQQTLRHRSKWLDDRVLD